MFLYYKFPEFLLHVDGMNDECLTMSMWYIVVFPFPQVGLNNLQGRRWWSARPVSISGYLSFPYDVPSNWRGFGYRTNYCFLSLFPLMSVTMWRILFLACVMIVLGQMHGYSGCIAKERKGLLEIKAYIISLKPDARLVWTNNQKSNCCHWERIKCDNSQRVVSLSLDALMFGNFNVPLNVSLFHPFEELQSLNLTFNRFGGLVDIHEGMIMLLFLIHFLVSSFREMEIKQPVRWERDIWLYFCFPFESLDRL